MNDKELAVAKQALEALKLLTDTEQTFGALDYGDNAITALQDLIDKQALAQPAAMIGAGLWQSGRCCNAIRVPMPMW